MAVPRVKDLVGISGADSRHPVGTLDRALHKVDVTIIGQHWIILLWDSKHIIEQLVPIYALILDIVDGKIVLIFSYPGTLA